MFELNIYLVKLCYTLKGLIYSLLMPNLQELLIKSVRLQDILHLSNEAASGVDNELTQEFVKHLLKLI